MICLDFLTKISTLIFILAGFILGRELIITNYTSPLYSIIIYNLSNFLGDMWFIPRVRTYIIYDSRLNLSLDYKGVIDIGWGEYLVSNILFKYNIYLSSIITIYQNNNIKYFILTFLVLFIIFLI